MNRPVVLVVDDDPQVLCSLRLMLDSGAYHVETATNGLQALERFRQAPVPDLVLLDTVMPELDGLETLARLRQLRPLVKVVMLSCEIDQNKAIEAIRLGARAWVTKPCERAALTATLNECLNSPSLVEGPDGLENAVEELADGLSFVAVSTAMRKLRLLVGLVAKIEIPVLCVGESGTGKEVVARLIHQLSPRSRRTFLKVNCAALPTELLESELFGYEPGAFTGAVRAKPGKFELCNKGTILLDEIAEMPPSLQAKLLHVLQDQEFSRLGGRSRVKVDVRVVAATNVDIKHAIAAKKLREDLFYRLSTVIVHLPPLRERREDIPVLLRYYLRRFAARYAIPQRNLPPELFELCLRYDWPGNVRELENFAKRYLILGETARLGQEAGQEELGFTVPCPSVNSAGSGTGDLKSTVRGLKDEAERSAISRALDETHWNRREAARLLNISYKCMLNKIRQYSIDQPAERSARLQEVDTDCGKGNTWNGG